MGCGGSKPGAAYAPVQTLKTATVVELAEKNLLRRTFPNHRPRVVPGAPAAEVWGWEGYDGIERNAGGSEEPHSADPELWNIGGTEVDLNAKYKVGKQMWYLQSRARDAARVDKPISGSPLNQKARDAKRLFAKGD